MLIDDDKRFVELIMENTMWGNVTFNWTNVSKEDCNNISEMMGNYIRLYKSDPNSKELEDLIPQLAIEFRAQRAIGDSIVGELRDREHEKKIEQLTKDNEQLAERLSQAYVPPQDGKIGTH